MRIDNNLITSSAVYGWIVLEPTSPIAQILEACADISVAGTYLHHPKS